MPISEDLSALRTIRDFIRWGSSEFVRNGLVFGHGFVCALDESRYLVLHALWLPYDWPDEYLDTALIPAERERIVELLQLRMDSRRPAAYLTNESWFCGLKFYVDERVLVPRSPIAELIADDFEPWVDSARVGSILDLCTGSGCIAIAAQYRFPEARVCASDVSAAALEVAARNLELHDLENRIALYRSDLFDSIPLQGFDVIVSNPPYVDAEDLAAMGAEYGFEPEIGLGAGNDGLAIAERILAAAGDYLSEDGVLFIELGNSQAALESKYPFLPLTWVELEHGTGVCCIRAQDLRNQQAAIVARAS